MARRVVGAGYEVLPTVHRRRTPAEEFAALGVTVLERPAEIAKQTGVIITVLSADAELVGGAGKRQPEWRF